MKIYLAGPMNARPLFNYPEFNFWADILREKGHTVFNPAENHDGKTDLPLADYMAADLPLVIEADAVAVLNGWRESNGANVEVTLARYLGKPILKVHNLEPVSSPPEGIAEEANRLVNGPRQADYGHPVTDFARTGKMWGAILGTASIAPETVGLMMVALKLSRQVNKPKRDNLVDAIGYILTVDMIEAL